MAQYDLADHYNEAERNDYTLGDLDRYLRALPGIELNESDRNSVGYAHQKLLVFLQEHGKTENRFERDSEGKPHFKPFQKCHPLRPEEPKEESFSYLQLLCYVIEKAGRHSVTTGKLLELISNPSQVNIPLYQEILGDLDAMVSAEEKERLKDIDHRAEVVWTCYELISIIAYSTFCDYANEPDQIDLQKFIAQVKERMFPELYGFPMRSGKNYFDAFYSIVAFARMGAEIVDMLHAFQKVKRDFSVGHSHIPECERMMHSEYRKVEESDNVVLAYQAGEIIEIRADQIEILNNQPSNEEYMRALGRYINAHLPELTTKVFCLDDSICIGKERMKQYKRKLKRRIERVAGFRAAETGRYQNQAVLTKAKLISIFQVILLSEPKAGVTAGRDHVTRTRPDRANGVEARETRSYSSVILENPDGPTYRDSYSQQEFCIWVYYQTLKNIASDQWATDYLDINITALESILEERNTLTPDQIQRKAEMMLRKAVRNLISEEDDAEELGSLYHSLQSELGADACVFTTHTFRKKVNPYRLGAFLRLFSVKQVKQRIVECLQPHREDEKFTATAVIDPYYTDINELPPLCIEIDWVRESDASSLTLKDLFGF